MTALNFIQLGAAVNGWPVVLTAKLSDYHSLIHIRLKNVDKSQRIT